jgi:hypothetical protein
MKEPANTGGLYFTSSGYFAGFPIDEMNLAAVATDRCLKVAIGAFGRIVVNFAPDLQRPFS